MLFVGCCMMSAVRCLLSAVSSVFTFVDSVLWDWTPEPCFDLHIRVSPHPLSSSPTLPTSPFSFHPTPCPQNGVFAERTACRLHPGRGPRAHTHTYAQTHTHAHTHTLVHTYIRIRIHPSFPPFSPSGCRRGSGSTADNNHARQQKITQDRQSCKR
jgi:hypothetical protein